MKLAGCHLEHVLAPRVAPEAESVTDIDTYIYIHTLAQIDPHTARLLYLPRTKALDNYSIMF